MLFDAKITNIAEWKAILHAISDITDEVMFICSQDGLVFRGIDPSHVALLDIAFPRSSFESFDCHATFFGIHVNDLRNILSIVSDGDVVEFKIDDPHKMKILIRGSLNMKYDLNLIEKSEVNTPIPKIDSKNKIIMSPVTLSKVISNIEKISEYVTISTKPEKLQFVGSGMVGRAQIDIKKTDSDISLFEIREYISSIYSLEYMVNIIRNIGRASKSVNIAYGKQTPIRLRFEMESKVQAEYYLAPRVES